MRINVFYLKLYNDFAVENKIWFFIFIFLFFYHRDEYTLEELKEKPLPEGVDPTRIEFYLNKEDFKVNIKINLILKNRIENRIFIEDSPPTLDFFSCFQGIAIYGYIQIQLQN